MMTTATPSTLTHYLRQMLRTWEHDERSDAELLALFARCGDEQVVAVVCARMASTNVSPASSRSRSSAQRGHCSRCPAKLFWSSSDACPSTSRRRVGWSGQEVIRVMIQSS